MRLNIGQETCGRDCKKKGRCVRMIYRAYTTDDGPDRLNRQIRSKFVKSPFKTSRCNPSLILPSIHPTYPTPPHTHFTTPVLNAGPTNIYVTPAWTSSCCTLTSWVSRLYRTSLCIERHNFCGRTIIGTTNGCWNKFAELGYLSAVQSLPVLQVRIPLSQTLLVRFFLNFLFLELGLCRWRSVELPSPPLPRSD